MRTTDFRSAGGVGRVVLCVASASCCVHQTLQSRVIAAARSQQRMRGAAVAEHSNPAPSERDTAAKVCYCGTQCWMRLKSLLKDRVFDIAMFSLGEVVDTSESVLGHVGE